MDKEQLRNYVNNTIEHLDNMSFDYGPVHVTIAWEPAYSEFGFTLKSWIGNQSLYKGHKPHLRCLISPSVYKKALTLNMHHSNIHTWAWDALSLFSNSKDTLWICTPNSTFKKEIIKKLPQLFIRISNPLFASYWELQAGYFVYHILMKILNDVLLTHDACFVHASAISDPYGNALLVTGSGGIGKTTTAAYLASKMGWKIIADDFVIVSQTGMVYDSHLPAHLYGYHTPIFDQLGIRNDLLFTSKLDRLHWNIYKYARGESSVVRRRSIPKSLRMLKGNIRMCIIVDVAEDNGNVIIQPVSYDEAAQSALEYTKFEIYNNSLSENSYWKPSDDHKAMSILMKSFSNVICYRVKISKHNRGFNLAKKIWQIVSENWHFVE